MKVRIWIHTIFSTSISIRFLIHLLATHCHLETRVGAVFIWTAWSCTWLLNHLSVNRSIPKSLIHKLFGYFPCKFFSPKVPIACCFLIDWPLQIQLPKWKGKKKYSNMFCELDVSEGQLVLSLEEGWVRRCFPAQPHRFIAAKVVRWWHQFKAITVSFLQIYQRQINKAF